MKQKDYEQSQRSLCEISEIYRKVTLEKFSVKEISRQYGISRSSAVHLSLRIRKKRKL